MLSFLPAFLIFPIHTALQVLNIAFWGGMIIILGVIKLVLPIKPLVNLINRIINPMLSAFGIGSVCLMKLFNHCQWEIDVNGTLSKQNWYLMLPNHLSWLDIVLLTKLSAGRIPAPKFFLKKELIWVPFIGLGAWALDMPFMQRYSRETLEKRPHLKGKDIETTRKSCEKFREIPTTVINFVEGSRFTPAKHKARKSPYDHLLPPKAGGIAFTLAAMGELFTNILDVTISYPQNEGRPMMDMLKGNLKAVVIKVNVLPVDAAIIGDYFNDDAFKGEFQEWLNTLWESKDQNLQSIHKEAVC